LKVRGAYQVFHYNLRIVQGDRTHEGNFMKQKTFFILLTFFTLILAGCQEKPAKKSSSSNPYNLNCTGQGYWTTPGCTGYCQYNPTAYGCGGTTGGTIGGTTGTTTGGTTTGTTAGGTTTGGGTTGNVNNCMTNPYSFACYCQTVPRGTGCPQGTNPLYPHWGEHYPGGVPAGSCSAPYNPSGVTQAYEPRVGTVTVAGETSGSIEYSPFSADAPNYLNTTPDLMSVASAKNFFITDSMLKVRIKVREQPETAQTAASLCYGRNFPASSMSGYTKLQYTVKVYKVNTGNSVSYLGSLGPYTTGVNSCSPALDLSNYAGMSPNGIVLTVSDVKANQNCWDNYTTSGFTTCNAYKNVRSFDCWSVDIQVAGDGTKTFD
jgi:hypothetical protein